LEQDTTSVEFVVQAAKRIDVNLAFNAKALQVRHEDIQASKDGGNSLRKLGAFHDVLKSATGLLGRVSEVESRKIIQGRGRNTNRRRTEFASDLLHCVFSDIQLADHVLHEGYLRRSNTAELHDELQKIGMVDQEAHCGRPKRWELINDLVEDFDHFCFLQGQV
jgi:hypothetical protein